MTDSTSTAKARETAEQFLSVHPNHWNPLTCERLTETIATALDAAVAEEREANCRAICEGCRNCWPIEQGESGKWWHRHGILACPCQAATIRGRPK